MDTTIRELSYSQAIQEAMAIAMERDDRVFLMGEDIGVYGGAFQVTGDLVHRFGEDRVMDTPISELGGAGVAVGAALTGMRPIFEFQFSDFAALAMEQIVNQAAKIRYMLGGAVSVPLVMRFPAQQKQCLRILMYLAMHQMVSPNNHVFHLSATELTVSRPPNDTTPRGSKFQKSANLSCFQILHRCPQRIEMISFSKRLSNVLSCLISMTLHPTLLVRILNKLR